MIVGGHQSGINPTARDTERAMSQENVELAKGLIRDFNRRDLAAVTEAFDPEVEWRPVGPAAVERAVYRGRDQVADGIAAGWDAWEVFHLKEREVRDLGDLVLWLGRAELRGGTSHVELDQEFAVQLEINAGSVVRMQGFLAWQEALAAAGLSE
jgi:SnoaL-like domain